MSGSTSAPAGIDLGLQRITTLLERLGSPQNKLPVIHVAGTNAKGSTTAYLDSLLSRAIGLRTGRFNSPHLVEERDACRVGGVPIQQDVWQKAVEAVQQQDQANEPLQCTSFEKVTASSLLAFTLLPVESRPEVILVEVGLGGRLDATNVFPASNVLASVLCPVDMDHESLLGNTLTAITNEKAAIVKPGGLIVVSDQRRPPSMTRDEDLQCTALRSANVERSQVGEQAAEVLDAARQLAFAAGARLVKSYIPWEALQAPPSASRSQDAPWAISVDVNARHSPSLYPSTSNSPSYAGTYSARAGDAVVAGPLLRVPRTRAAITGALTAVQTLWAIARDETPGGLGQNGSDPHEELRLRIAWALRDDRDATDVLRYAVESTRWEGRGEWKDVSLPSPVKLPEPAVAEEATSKDVDKPVSETTGAESEAIEAEPPVEHAQVKAAETSPAVTSLHLHIDGAHNPSATQALRKYLDDAIAARLDALASSTQVELTVTYLLGFSAGKDVKGMMEHLLGSNADESLAGQVAKVSLGVGGSQIKIVQRVGLLCFSTPVEGMPWVKPLPTEEATQALKAVAPDCEMRTFETQLSEALQWAAEAGDGRSIVSTQAAGQVQLSLNVLAGSLYLVGDLYRFIG